ncbi:hypothetical protein HWV62_24446, partial [Athelia sp. TMB]
MSGTPVDAASLKPALAALASAGSSRPGSEASVHRVKNETGYTTPVFAGKEKQRAEVQKAVASQGFMPRELVANEVNWFYTHLGIDDTYFQNESCEVIADHILSLFGAK